MRVLLNGLLGSDQVPGASQARSAAFVLYRKLRCNSYAV